MNYSTPEHTFIELKARIEKKLNDSSLMFRIFSRIKSEQSMSKKIENKKQKNSSKKIQDHFGFRVVLYFPDDIKFVHDLLNDTFSEKEKDNSIDDMGLSDFKPIRYNIIYKIPDDIIYSKKIKNDNYIDRTFEVQIRSVLSEGWHEVEHDLRYKNKSDWTENTEESRKLNGVYASLETNEWTMIKIFEELSYSHYKKRNWDSMMRQKLRIRLPDEDLSDEIKNILDNDISLAKKIYRIDRLEILNIISMPEFYFQKNLNNIIFFLNEKIIFNEKINEITPSSIIKEISTL